MIVGKDRLKMKFWDILANTIKNIFSAHSKAKTQKNQEKKDSSPIEEKEIAFPVGQYIEIPIETESTHEFNSVENRNTSESIGAKRIVYAIRSRYPELSVEEAEKYAGIVLVELAKRIGAGDQLVHLSKNKNSLDEIIPYVVEGLY